MKGSVRLYRLGLKDYGWALGWQGSMAQAVAAGEAGEALALLQHPPVYTVGVRGRRQNLLMDPVELERRGALIHDVSRGGDVTFHGPGQLVVYPILDLRSRGLGAASYVRALETTAIVALQRLGVCGYQAPGRPGIWAGGAKIAALGVRIQRGVSSHGLALNVDTNLEWFEAIVPCGLPGTEATSLKRILGAAPSMNVVEDEFAQAFSEVFEVRLVHAVTTAATMSGLAAPHGG